LPALRVTGKSVVMVVFIVSFRPTPDQSPG
jgi:hypothetical protein